MSAVGAQTYTPDRSAAITTQTFTDGVTQSASSWATDVDTATYSALTGVTGTNTVAGTGPASMTAYASGQMFRFVPAGANTGAATLNITANSIALGAKNIFSRGLALVGGEIVNGRPVVVVYDGTQFNIVGNGYPQPVLRSYLAGLGMTPGTGTSTSTMSIAAGQCADINNAKLMNLTSAILKTTAAWSLGNNGGGLDTGAIANGSTYHFHAIERLDTNVVDVVFSLNVSSPTLPTSYNLSRRIASALTGATSTWTAFVQDGDLFELSVPVGTVSATNPGTSAVVTTVSSIPSGMSVLAWINAVLNNGTTDNIALYLSDPNVTDSTAVAGSRSSLQGIAGQATAASSADFYVRTNTSSQIRYRLSASGVGDVVKIASKGWIDRRGRDA